MELMRLEGPTQFLWERETMVKGIDPGGEGLRWALPISPTHHSVTTGTVMLSVP